MNLWYGGDYNPEQWDPAVWKEDVDLMRRAGVNLVTVGVFSWSSLEPRPGEYTFGWLDEVQEFHPLGEGVALASGGRGRLWAEDVQAFAAEVVDRYAGGVLDGRPAITRRQAGAGTAWYVSTELDDETAGALVEQLTGADGVAEVETIQRRSGDTSWTFLINHGEDVVVPATGVELVSGTTVDGELQLPAGGYAVVRCSRAQ
ncbi:beta-galactosidase [Kribbella sp. WER1]